MHVSPRDSQSRYGVTSQPNTGRVRPALGDFFLA